MRRAFPSDHTVEGRALFQLQVMHAIYREESVVSLTTRLEWRHTARMLAQIISGRRPYDYVLDGPVRFDTPKRRGTEGA